MEDGGGGTHVHRGLLCACACIWVCHYASMHHIFVQVEDVGGARFKVTLGPNGSMQPPYVGALAYDCYGAQSMISAPRDIGDADFEMHDLKSMSAWHRPHHTPVPTLP